MGRRPGVQLSSWLGIPPPLDQPDDRTPLFDALWTVHMGKHFDRDHDGVADHAEAEFREAASFATDDGSVYRRLAAEELE